MTTACDILARLAAVPDELRAAVWHGMCEVPSSCEVRPGRDVLRAPASSERPARVDDVRIRRCVAVEMSAWLWSAVLDRAFCRSPLATVQERTVSDCESLVGKSKGVAGASTSCLRIHDEDYPRGDHESTC